jgi:hypothetical protein
MLHQKPVRADLRDLGLKRFAGCVQYFNVSG